MIEMATEGPLELARCDLQIRDRYIAALILSPMIDGDDVFTMWDWKSGECVLVSSPPYILCISSTTHFLTMYFSTSTNWAPARTPFSMSARRCWWSHRTIG